MSTATRAMSTTSTEAAKTFTFNDLVKIALGAPKLSGEHLSVLQSLLIILLQKLNCHNETVRIQGFPATYLRQMLSGMPANTQYDFKLQTLQGFKEKYELLEQLEQRTQEVQTKLEQHFQVVRNCYKTCIFKAELWDHYAAPDEDLCTYYMPSNKELCLLFRNAVFNKELRRRSTHPLNEKIQVFKNKITKMQLKVQELTKQIKETPSKLDCVKYIIHDIETIRPSIERNNEKFREAMAEAQEMLNCKVERVAFPALRRFLDERFIKLRKHYKHLTVGSNQCELWKPLTIKASTSTCISCSIYDELKHLHKLKPVKSIEENVKRLCNNVAREATILERIDRMVTYRILSNENKRSSSIVKQNTNTRSTGILKFDESVVFRQKRKMVKSITKKPTRAPKISSSTASIRSLRQHKLQTVGLTKYYLNYVRNQNK